MRDKTIYMGSDHGGFALKEAIAQYVAAEGFTVVDKGTTSTESCDYPEFGIAAAEAVAADPGSRGIVICTTGIGISICANKVTGIRAALCMNEDQALMTRRHNDSNVLALPAKYVTVEEAMRIVSAWLNEPFEGGRHQRRVDIITDYESK